MTKREDGGAAFRVIGNLSNPRHPADGLTAHVFVGGGAVHSICNPQSFTDGGMVWRLTYADAGSLRHAAASLIESYDYLLSGNINMTEATRRLRLLRSARRLLAARAPQSGDGE